MKFFASIDNKYVPCKKIAVVYPPLEGEEEGLRIEAILEPEGIVVNILDHQDEVVEAVHVKRGDLPQGFTKQPTLTPEEALEDLHLSLTEAVEAGVEVGELFTYLLSRSAEVAVGSGMSSANFVRTALSVYEGALVLQTENRVNEKEIGEA
jgi:hypothetical protein